MKLTSSRASLVLVCKVTLLVSLSATSLRADAGALTVAARRYVAMFEASASKPLPSNYPELADRFRTLFPELGAVRVETPASKEGAKERTEIYADGNNIEIVAPLGERNFSTDGQYVYEWLTGAASGIRIKRVNTDIVAFLYYETDPSWIMASLYFGYLKTPDSFQVKKTSATGVFEFVLKKPIEGFESVSASQKPLWFYGFKANGTVLKFSAPTRLNQIPLSVSERRKTIVFADSEETLAVHMVFL
jgi:hypothetical protein